MKHPVHLHSILVAAAIAAVSAAQADPYCYHDYSGIEWYFTVDADGGATIESTYPPGYDPMSGPDSMYYYYYWDGTIPSTVCNDDDWVLGDPPTQYPVTAIGESALSGLAYSGSGDPSSVTSITIPATVKRIGDYAFSGFSNVTDIDLPEGLEYLGWDPFSGCNSLSYDWEYYDLRVLDGWVLGPWGWEFGYSYVESADMSAAKGIAAGAFSGTTLRSAILPVNLKIIPHAAFHGTSLTDIVIPASVTNIEANAFSSCSSLTNITFVGNAPAVQLDPNAENPALSNPFYGVSQQCIVTVQQGTTGWGTVPGTWNGLPTQYATAPATYTVTWLDSDGTLIDENSSWVYGATPSHTDPVKASDAQYDYYFMYWTPELEPVVSNVTYTAVWSANLRYYTITWLNENGSRINTTSVGFGSVPTHADATKAPTAFHTYTFAGWTPSPVAVSGPATYRATFTAVPKYAGSGTEADPFIATSKADLAALVTVTNTLYVQLAPGLSIDGPITVPASMTLLSLDMNGGAIAGANGDPAIILQGNTTFSVKGSGTISAAYGVEAVRRPGSVAATSGVTITGLGGGGDAAPATFAADGESITSGIEQGANGKWTLTAFAELKSGSVAGLDDAQIKVYAADTPAGLATAQPMASGVVVTDKAPAVKVDVNVAPPANADAQFFRIGFGN